MLNTIEISIRIILSCILAGLIGMERESVNRPAGFRTHILVSLGSTVVMIVNIQLYEILKDFASLDPTRLGAQVISGIGFLGAGTILKEGLTVKGLTTAASLWATACIGLCVGSGFYFLSIFATLIILVILLVFSRFEKYIAKKHNHLLIKLIASNKPGQLGKIGTLFGKMNITITNITLEPVEEDISIMLTVNVPRNVKSMTIMENLNSVDGIKSVEIID